MKNRERLQAGFDRLSPFYDAAAALFFGRSLWRAQSHFISSLAHAKHALIIGGGTGKILEEMMKQNIADRYYYLDISPQMVKRAKQRAERNPKEQLSSVTFHAGDIHDLPSDISFDLIVTPFLLDMLDAGELMADMSAMDKKLDAGGTWLFTDFNYPKKKGFASFISRPLIGLLYAVFRIMTSAGNKSLPDFEKAFASLGYKNKSERYFLGGLLVTRIYQRSKE